jgi:hypothetical protein
MQYSSYYLIVQSFMLARQAFYCLSHASTPFSFNHFEDSVPLFAHACLENDPLILGF